MCEAARLRRSSITPGFSSLQPMMVTFPDFMALVFFRHLDLFDSICAFYSEFAQFTSRERCEWLYGFWTLLE